MSISHPVTATTALNLCKEKKQYLIFIASEVLVIITFYALSCELHAVPVLEELFSVSDTTLLRQGHFITFGFTLRVLF